MRAGICIRVGSCMGRAGPPGERVVGVCQDPGGSGGIVLLPVGWRLWPLWSAVGRGGGSCRAGFGSKCMFLGFLGFSVVSGVLGFICCFWVSGLGEWCVGLVCGGVEGRGEKGLLPYSWLMVLPVSSQWRSPLLSWA